MKKNNFVLGALIASSLLETACSSTRQNLPNVRVDLSIQKLCRNQHLSPQDCIAQVSRNIQTQIQVRPQDNTHSLSAFSYQKSHESRYQPSYTFSPQQSSIMSFHTRRSVPPLTSLYVSPEDFKRTQSQLEINSFLISNDLSDKFECQFNQETNIVVCRSMTPNLTLEEVANLREFLENKNYTIHIKEDFLIGIK
ncbi:hypothetical protein CL656_02460 [bacterium]|nr:hypothetical protein [bacterium]|tara:strand:+ start:5468 stop:6052 length:585 start_codon:yes stop_codon:yes gene_type:complete